MIEKAGDLLKGILGDEKLKDARRVSSMFRGWDRIAGTDIASHSRIKDLRHGVIVVEVDHPGWIQMIQMNRKSIVRSVAKAYPELNIKDMRCVLQTKKEVKTEVEEKSEPPAGQDVQEPPTEEPGREGFDALLGRLADSISRRDKDLES